MADMTRRDTVAWAKEEILAAVDKTVTELLTEHVIIHTLSLTTGRKNTCKPESFARWNYRLVEEGA